MVVVHCNDSGNGIAGFLVPIHHSYAGLPGNYGIPMQSHSSKPKNYSLARSKLRFGDPSGQSRFSFLISHFYRYQVSHY